MVTAPARPASTVVLARPAAAGFEVFLVRRRDDIAFMGGAHVFPGGRVDQGDHLDAPDAWCDGVSRATARMPDHTPHEAVGFYIAGLRELFEEAGVLLARDASGAFVAGSDLATRFDASRRDLLAGRVTLRDLAERERLRLALDALALFAHWVTPDIETRRFDTHFFLAIAPPAQMAAHHDDESSESIWIAPADAIERCQNGEIALPPPTWTTLRMLAACADVDAAWRWAESQPIVRVQPRVNVLADGSREILLPSLEGFAPRETRFLLTAGRWLPA